MVSFDDFKVFLPKYLTPEAQKNLFEELEKFPNNIENKLCSEICRHENTIYQGDGIDKLLVINLPDMTTKEVPVMIISNSCDVNPANIRMFDSNICYCPIMNLRKYREMLLKNGEEKEAVENHIQDIKNQRIAQIFYLPKPGILKEESMVFFDKIISCASDYIPRENISKRKLFSLSDYGLYIFVVKLSIHFTRINEGEGRDEYLSAYKI